MWLKTWGFCTGSKLGLFGYKQAWNLIFACSGKLSSGLRLDNTGAWVFEVYPSLLCIRMSENVDLCIKLKLGIFSFI